MVVDLCGRQTTCDNFNADSLVNVFSSTKSLTAICVATLVEKGLLNYSDKISHHWPEFGNGDATKEVLTVADVLRHRAGLAVFHETLKLVDLLRENIKKNAVGRIVEKEPIIFPPGNSKTQYHDLTRGWILNEIFRRVDPAGRTIGECLAEEVAGPLKSDCYIGVPYENLGRVSPITCQGLKTVVGRSMVPKMFGRESAMGARDLMRMMNIFRNELTDSEVPPAMELFPKGLEVSLIEHAEMDQGRGEFGSPK